MSIEPYKVVVVGASAGGLSALERFVGTVPPDCGMTFLIIQHLAPDHRSLLTELLAPKAQLPVCEIENAQVLEPNRIYISPARMIPVADGYKVHLRAWPKENKLVLPINTYLQSLAETVGDSSIAVILSGTESDGTEGAKHIRMHGGEVFAQSPGDCEFPGMPQSVVSADAYCTVADADKLWSLIEAAQQGDTLSLGSDTHAANSEQLPDSKAAVDPEEYAALFQYLHQQFNLDFSGYQLSSIGRRLQRRMQLLSIPTTTAYLAYIQENADECQALYKDLLIGVTQFFRDQPAFDVLSRQALEPALKNCKGQDFRIWVAGCASGEEAYSLCILALEVAAQVGYSGRVSVFASDVFQPAIDFASAGIYDAKRLAPLGDTLRDRYFNQTGPSLYRVKPKLRERVVFAQHNLLVDPPFAKIDLVSCRNVLIYLLPESQERALKSFSYALAGEGILFLGMSESLGIYTSDYEVLASREKIFRKHNNLAVDTERWVKPFLSDRKTKDTPEHTHKLDPSVSITKDLLSAYDSILSRYAPDGFLVNKDQEVLHYLGSGSDFCIHAKGRASLDVLSQVDDDLRVAINSLFHQVRHYKKRCTLKHVQCKKGDEAIVVNVSLELLQESKRDAQVYLIELSDARAIPVIELPKDAASDETEVMDCSLREQLKILEDELHSTKDNFKAASHALQVANEELNAFNEEANVSNEELQSTNEELNSMNEELITLNAEYEKKNEQLIKLDTSHNNLLRSTEDGVLFVDKEMLIQRFNDSIARAFNLQPSDVGRSLSDIAFNLGDREEMLQDVSDVLGGKDRVERETVFFDDRRYLRRVAPFLSEENEIQGALLIFTDVTVLRELERHFKNAVKAALMSWWNWDLESGQLEVHSAGERLMGEGCLDRQRDRDGWMESVQRDRDGWMEAVHPGDREMVEESLDAHLRGETEEWSCQHRFRQSSGGWLWVNNHGVVTRRHPDGDPVEMIGTIQDVDAYQKAHIAVTAQRNILEVAGQIAKLGAWEYEIESEKLTWSEEVYRILGVEFGREMSSEDSFQYFSAKCREELEHAFKKAVNEGVDYDLELECVNSEGEQLITRALGQAQRDANGQVVRVVGVFQDITEAVTTEEGIRAFFALSPDFQAILNFEGIFQLFSPTWLSQFGMTTEALKATSVVSLLHPEDRSEFTEVFASSVEGVQTKSFEARILTCKETKCGSQEEDVWLSWSLSSDPRLGLVFICARDVTEQKYATWRLKEARLRAEEANQSKSDFLSVMSHELRTPLNPILGFAELLAEEIEDPEQRDILNTIVASGSHLIHLIDEILDYSKAEAGRTEVVLVEFSLVDLVEEKMNLMRGGLKRDGIEFTYEIDKGAFEKTDLPIFKGDVDMLKQILRNLLGNAMKFTSAGHIILRVKILSVDHLDAVVSFEVEDTGIGIRPNFHEQIFEPFVQADSSQTRAYGGTGLGLAICKRLTELLGGTISVESVVGKGTTFRVIVPLQIIPNSHQEDTFNDESKASPVKSATPQQKYSGLEVLVVEDDESNRVFIKCLLKRYGFSPTLVGSGEEALEVLEQHTEPFAVIFLDLHMPGMGGSATLKEIRRRESLSKDKAAPIIVISADVAESTQQECMDAGASAFLSKPLGINQLDALLPKWILSD